MHDPSAADLRSFIEIPKDSDFSIQNLPYGIFRPTASAAPRVGVAIGHLVLDLAICEAGGLLASQYLDGKNYFSQSTLNAFMSAGRPAWRAARQAISQLLLHDNPVLRDNQALRDRAFFPINSVEMLLPCQIGDYTDFYSSKEHAINVGTMFRGKENALMPNWTWIPVGYHGRASSVIVSGMPVRRPSGQTKADDAAAPVFGPCKLMDFELEMGFFTGPGNALGNPIAVDTAEEHIFGMVLVNDWSARDIQKWEYVPLGPFLAKNFATSISPWVVTMDALEPFRVAGPQQDPAPLAYLAASRKQAFDIRLDVAIQGENMDTPAVVCRSNFRHLYWSMAQQLAHHTITGCNMNPGDLLASGTISGPTADSYGSMLELAWRGSKPVKLNDSEQRSFLKDGDTVVISGWCDGGDYRVGFGEVRSKILPALDRWNDQ